MAETKQAAAPKGWKAAARNTKFGDWIKLETMPGYSVRPQKMAVEQGAKYRTMLSERAKGTPATKKILERAAVRWKGEHPESEDEPDTMECLEYMTDAEADVFTDTMAKIANDAEYVRFLVFYGIAESDLDDEKGQKITWGEEIVDQLMQYDDVAREIAGIAQRWNAPLRGGSGDSL